MEYILLYNIMDLALLFREDPTKFADILGKQITPILDDDVKLNTIIHNICIKIYKYDIQHGTPGYIYILYNNMFDHFGNNVYKVGETIDINNRIKGYTTCYIDPVEIKYLSKQLTNKSLAEAMVFNKLSKYRINSNREFFKCEVDIIISVINNIETQFDTLDNIDYDDYYMNLIKINILKILNDSCHININLKIERTKYDTPINIYNANIVSDEIYNNIRTSVDINHKLSCIKYKYIKHFNLTDNNITIDFFKTWYKKINIIKNHRRLLNQHNTDKDIIIIRNIIKHLQFDIENINIQHSITQAKIDTKLSEYFNNTDLFADSNSWRLFGIKTIDINNLKTLKQKIYCINNLLQKYGIKIQYYQHSTTKRTINNIRKTVHKPLYYLNYYNNLYLYL
jgi:hypothetical protein